MIVVVSDLHLTDGASGTPVEAGAFAVFARLIGDLARHASHRGSGVFRPPEAMDVVLLGDILDFLRSSAWPERSSPGERVPRPWEPPEIALPVLLTAAERILERNADGVGMLRALAREGAAFYEGERLHRVPVRITYFVGNHDWMLRLPQPGYERLRAVAVEGLGLDQDPAVPFPHDVTEAPAPFRDRAHAHRLFLRHGDVYDAINFAGDRNRSALGDAVVLEVLNRFPEEVRRELGLGRDDPLFLALREVDNVRPFTLIPPWVLGVMRRFGLERTPSGRRVVRVWERLGREFFALPFVRAQQRVLRVDDVDRLRLGFRFVRAFVSGRVRRAVAGRLLQLVVADRNREFAERALNEPAIETGDARFVVYGHTHVQQTVPLAIRRMGAVAKQFYFNAGTWRPTYRPTVGNPERLEFLGHNALAVTALYLGDERAGRGFETWSGTLEGPA